MIPELNQLVSRWLLRRRLSEALTWAGRGLAGGLAAGVGLALVARLTPLRPLPTLIWLTAAFALGWTAVAWLAAFFWPRPLLPAARTFDRRFGLAERTSTALELALRPADAPDWLRREQAADALASALRVDPRRMMPFAIGRAEALAALALAAILTLSLALPNPQAGALAQQAAVGNAIAQQVTRIEALRREIEANPALTEAQKEALTRPLAEAQQKLSQGRLTQEQAVSALQGAEGQLRQLADPGAQTRAQALQQAGQALAGAGGENPLEGFGQALAPDSGNRGLARGDFQAAAQALGNLDPAQLSPEEQAALAAQLEALAQATAAADPALAAEGLAQAAQALRAGDVTGARQALQAAAGALSQAAGQIAQSQAAGQAAEGLTQGGVGRGMAPGRGGRAAAARARVRVRGPVAAQVAGRGWGRGRGGRPARIPSSRATDRATGVSAATSRSIPRIAWRAAAGRRSICRAAGSPVGKWSGRGTPPRARAGRPPCRTIRFIRPTARRPIRLSIPVRCRPA
ncbi:MAG: hypothetical protein HY784_14630 [Chloroflexi bacterium]|nr:hypothetical protein [Chloroflexota bacterium]